MTNTTTDTTTTDTTTTDTSATGTGNPVTWFEIHTAAPDRAKDFYGAVFGWTFDDAMPGYSMIGTGDAAPIGGGIADSDGAYPDGAIFLVQVADVSATLSKITAAGGSIVADAQTLDMGLTFAYAANPDGSVFGLWCPPPDA